MEEKVNADNLFSTLNSINVNDKTEKKGNLTYLSWSWAWQEFLKVDPYAVYEVKMFSDGNGGLLPYCGNAKHGYMVFTEVTSCGITRGCYLPVMDGANKAMKDEPYSYGYNGGKTVEAMTMFDVNKAIMRCLTKNLAMFGLGLYIYSGEDLPDGEEPPKPAKVTASQLSEISALNVNIANVCTRFNVWKIEDITEEQADFVIRSKKNAMSKESN